ncbi:MAG TPA: Zn-binding domain-containing protein, partial [Tepidisphaeraceae bacterium]|nr:Zn-binding domain-containing protein [Tepidisphaeraceae bacterium]
IAEYAPGAEVIAAKRVWTGGGLYKQPKKDWPVYHYAVCRACGRFHRSAEAIGTVCPGCGSSFHDRRLCGTFIVPEFGFVAARDSVRSPGETRPQRLYASRVYFAEYAPPRRDGQSKSEPIFEPVPELSNERMQVRKYYSRFGKLALVNAGVAGRGFLICQSCGYAEIAPEPSPPGARRRSGPTTHKHPRTGRDCTGYRQRHHLGHEFLTDVTELRFTGLLALHAEEKLWRSLVYALLEGAAQALEIRRDDLDGTFYRHSGTPAVVLFDNVPGGAGHVRRIAESVVPVVHAAYQRVNNECCGPETSCYECLRNFYNQPYHEDLRRGLVRDFLRSMLANIV